MSDEKSPTPASDNVPPMAGPLDGVPPDPAGFSVNDSHGDVHMNGHGTGNGVNNNIGMNGNGNGNGLNGNGLNGNGKHGPRLKNLHDLEVKELKEGQSRCTIEIQTSTNGEQCHDFLLNCDGGSPNIIIWRACIKSKSGAPKYYFQFVPQANISTRVGFASLKHVRAWKTGARLGDDNFSWGYDGKRCERLHNGVEGRGQLQWDAGDTIGCGYDGDRKVIEFFTGSGSERRVFVIHKNVEASALVPVITMSNGQSLFLDMNRKTVEADGGALPDGYVTFLDCESKEKNDEDSEEEDLPIRESTTSPSGTTAAPTAQAQTPIYTRPPTAKPIQPENKESAVRLSALKPFLEAMKDWRDQAKIASDSAEEVKRSNNRGGFDDRNANRNRFSVRSAACTVSQKLQSYAMSQGEESSPVCIIGNQTCGKTALVSYLTRTNCLLVSNKQATKARTRVSKSYNPTATTERVTFRYRDVYKPKVSMDAMRTAYCEAFPQDSPFDPDALAQVEMETSDPTFGCMVVDHPGFVLAGSDATMAMANASLDQYFVRGTGCLLICHRITSDFGEGGWLNLDLHQVPKGRLFFAITQMDLMNHQTIANLVKEEQPHSPVEILDALDHYLKSIKVKGRLVVPSHAELFFVATSAIETSDVAKRQQQHSDWSSWAIFRDDSNKGHAVNEQSMRDKLNDLDSWRRQELQIERNSAQEAERMATKVGVDNLFNRLFALQNEGTIAIARKAAEKASQQAREAEIELSRLGDQSSNQEGLVPGKMLEFLTRNISLFHELADSQPQPVTGKDSINLNQIYLDRSQHPTCGWNFDEEKKIYESLPRIGQFPPDHMSVSRAPANSPEFISLGDCNNLVHRLTRLCDKKLHTLNKLVERLEQEYATIAQFVWVPPVDMDDVMAKMKHKTSGDASSPLNSFIINEFLQLFYKRDETAGHVVGTGNYMVAGRAALCMLMHQETVIDLLLRHPGFSSLVTPIKIQADRAVLGLTGQLAKSSRHQNQKLTAAATTPASTAHFSRQTQTLKGFFDKCRKGSDVMSTRTDATGAKVEVAVKQGQDIYVRKTYPIEDIHSISIAMFFDSTHERVLSELDMATASLAKTSPVFVAASATFAPLFVWQDPKFLVRYRQSYPSNVYSRKFLRDIPTGDINVPTVAEASDTQLAAIQDLIAVEKRPQARKVLRDVLVAQLQDKPGLLKSHEYESEDARLFDGVECRDFASSIHQLQRLEPQGRASLVSSLIRQGSGPDVAITLQSQTDLSRYEAESLNYVNRRYVTAAVFDTVKSTLRILTAFSTAWYSQAETQAHILEILERYVSILLGYGYAYSNEERPDSLFHLHPDNIIPFLWRYKQFFLAGKDDKSMPITNKEFESNKSPLVALIWRMIEEHKAKPEEKEDDLMPVERPEHVIASLYEAWEGRKNPEIRREMNQQLIKLLARERYRHMSDAGSRRKRQEALQDQLFEWQKASRELDSYVQFLENNPSILGSGDLPQSDRFKAPSEIQMPAKAAGGGIDLSPSEVAEPPSFLPDDFESSLR